MHYIIGEGSYLEREIDGVSVTLFYPTNDKELALFDLIDDGGSEKDAGNKGTLLRVNKWVDLLVRSVGDVVFGNDAPSGKMSFGKKLKLFNLIQDNLDILIGTSEDDRKN